MTSPQDLSNQNDLVEIINGFNSWLNSKSYSISTVRNYLSDINRYFNFIKSQKSTAALSREAVEERETEGFLPETISAYLDTIKPDSNYNRYLSSLSKFFQYALDQNLIKIDPLKQTQKVKKPSTEDILADYQSFLTKKHFSVSTIRNYLNDLRQFIDWSKNSSEPR